MCQLDGSALCMQNMTVIVLIILAAPMASELGASSWPRPAAALCGGGIGKQDAGVSLGCCKKAQIKSMAATPFEGPLLGAPLVSQNPCALGDAQVWRGGWEVGQQLPRFGSPSPQGACRCQAVHLYLQSSLHSLTSFPPPPPPA